MWRDSGDENDIKNLIKKTGKTLKEIGNLIGLHESSVWRAKKKGTMLEMNYQKLKELAFDIRTIDEFSDQELFTELRLRGHNV